MKKVYLYLRRSTRYQVYSFITQRSIIKEFLDESKEKYDVVGELEETCTGMNTNRPRFNELVDYCISNDIILMVSHIDRMTRCLNDFDNLTTKGLKFISLDCMHNSFEEIRFKVMMSEMITKRNNASTSNALSEAKKYKKLGNKDGWKYTQEKAQATRRKNMEDWITTGRNIYDVVIKCPSLNQAAKKLNEMNIRTFRGKMWQPVQVKRFLDSYIP